MACEASRTPSIRMLGRSSTASDGRDSGRGRPRPRRFVEHIPDAQALLKERVADEHPRVRLEAVRALARIPSAAAAGELHSRCWTEPMDRFLDYGLWLTVNELAEPLLVSAEGRRPVSSTRKHRIRVESIEPRAKRRSCWRKC